MRHPPSDEVRALAFAGKMVQAIKLHAQEHGLMLKPAKDEVEELRGRPYSAGRTAAQ